MKYLVALFIAFSVMFTCSAIASLGDRWRAFCERHIVADDPYQFEDLTTDQLVMVWFGYYKNKRPAVLVNEIKRRLNGNLSRDDREILSSLLGKR